MSAIALSQNLREKKMTQLDWSPPFDVIINIVGEGALNLQVHYSTPHAIKEILKPLEEKGVSFFQIAREGRFFSISDFPPLKVKEVVEEIANLLKENNISAKCYDNRPQTSLSGFNSRHPCSTEPTNEVEPTAGIDVLIKGSGTNGLYMRVHNERSDEVDTILAPLKNMGLCVDRILDNTFHVGRIYADREGLAQSISRALTKIGMSVEWK